MEFFQQSSFDEPGSSKAFFALVTDEEVEASVSYRPLLLGIVYAPSRFNEHIGNLSLGFSCLDEVDTKRRGAK